MKQAILVVSFGTTHLDTLEQNITRLEQELTEQFPAYQIFRAFTSPTIRSRLLSRHGIRIPSAEEALEQLVHDGYGCVTVQPTLLIPGEEYSRLTQTLELFRDRLEIRLGRPLLWEERDFAPMVQLLKQTFRPEPDTALVLMGHGTEHAANSVYEHMARLLEQDPDCCMRLCTVDGVPSFADAVESLRAQPRRKVIAAPMMLVAGDHAKNDMSGPEPDSLRSMLEREGFHVDCRIQGLGQLPQIRRIYAERIRQAERL